MSKCKHGNEKIVWGQPCPQCAATPTEPFDNMRSLTPEESADMKKFTKTQYKPLAPPVTQTGEVRKRVINACIAEIRKLFTTCDKSNVACHMVDIEARGRKGKRENEPKV